MGEAASGGHPSFTVHGAIASVPGAVGDGQRMPLCSIARTAAQDRDRDNTDTRTTYHSHGLRVIDLPHTTTRFGRHVPSIAIINTPKPSVIRLNNVLCRGSVLLMVRRKKYVISAAAARYRRAGGRRRTAPADRHDARKSWSCSVSVEAPASGSRCAANSASISAQSYGLSTSRAIGITSRSSFRMCSK